MHSFRLRLTVALVVCVTLVSVASTYFEVLAHKHLLREDLERRSTWLGSGIQPDFERTVASGYMAPLVDLLQRSKERAGVLALAVYDPQGDILASSGPSGLLQSLAQAPIQKSLRKGANIAAFGHAGDMQWLQEAFPLHDGNRLLGALVLVADAGYIRTEGNDLWQRSFLRILALVILIAAITFVMVRWFLMEPVTRVAERLRHLRMGHGERAPRDNRDGLGIFTPLAREMETMAENLIAARAAAETEARLRDAGENLWTAERLAVHMRDRSGSSRIFVVSNREPYIHERKGGEVVCSVPPSGLVTAIEPVLRACDGVWVAHGNGSADRQVVDGFDRLRVPPDDPRYTLRRVWLSNEEQAGYYEGFANEGIWPLCHIAHTRPIFRAEDWKYYQAVNLKFADALLEEMKDVEKPI